MKMLSIVNSRDAKLSFLYNRVLNHPSEKSHKDLATEISRRMNIDRVFTLFAGAELTDDQEFPLPRNFECLRSMINTYETSCGKFDEYDLKYVKYFAKECESLETASAIEEPITRLQAICAY